MRFFSLMALLLFVPSLPAQERCPSTTPPAAPLSAESKEFIDPACPRPQSSQQNPAPQQPASPDNTNSFTQAPPNPPQQATPPADQQDTSNLPGQPKRILGVMPNFRAVSAGTLPPPPTPKQSFVLATQNSFDYSSFIFVGVTSALAEWTEAHPQLGQGMPGFGRYYWRGFVDKADGNYLVLFALPTIFHEDERYYALGKGGIWKRATYSASRILITPNYQGHNAFNFAELLGRAISQGISVSYYPSQTRTAGAVSTKFGYAIGRDALTNVFREFWPDIAAHVLHRHP